jgi:hypothetical protein
MRARGDASGCQLLIELRLDEVTRPEDPRLGDLVGFLQRTFADPNSVLGLDRIREFLSETAAGGSRRFHVLIASEVDQPLARLLGTSIFSYVVRSNCGFSEYLAVDTSLRQQGLARALFDRRRLVLDEDAVRYGRDACRGLFIEVDSPWRTPPSLLALESLDPMERLRVFSHFGFRRVNVAYVQPPLAPDKLAVEHMDLLFIPFGDAAPIPSEWLVETLEAIWSAWAPESVATYLAELQRQVTTPTVALVDPLSPS